MVINIQNEGKIKVQGIRTRKNCKAVFCITTGEIYASVTDAAEQLGVTPGNISLAATRRVKTCKGRQLCFVSDVSEHLDEIAGTLRTHCMKASNYDEMIAHQKALDEANNSLATHRARCEALQKELEEATALEMPMMQENLPIIGSIVTLGTLTGLLGTVMGMIKSFQAMSSGDGGADSTQLATGISEALVNTASGIATSLFAVIGYNYYTNKIDRLTFCIDEVGFCIVQTYNATH
jgi:biopolymer transport protein ExbB/TolQ